MADGSPPNPPPNPTDPWLEGLTFEQVAQLVNEGSPDVFYQRASAFDQSGARFQDVLDGIRHEMNLVREAWTGKASDDFDAVVREVTGKITTVLQFLQSPGYGAILRDAGDRLADHQRRFRDLEGQKAQQDSAPPAPGAPSAEETAKLNGDAAKQVLRDLRTAYWDIGNALAPLPYKPPQVAADTTTVPNNQPANGNGDQGNGNPDETNNLGPTGLFGPNTLTKASTSESGPSGESEPYLFGGQDSSVLGRGDHALAGPGPVLASTQHQQSGPGALADALDVTQGQGPFLEGVSGGPLSLSGVVAPAVLGRSQTRPNSSGPAGKGVTARSTGKEKERDERETAEELLQEPEEERAETLSAETLPTLTLPALHPPAQTVDTHTKLETVRTAIDVPDRTTDKTDSQKAHELVAQVVTATGEVRPAVPQTHAGVTGTHAVPPAEAAVSDAHVVANLKHALQTDAPGTPLTFSLASGGGGGGVTHAVHLDPQARGMSAATTTPDGLVTQVPAETVTGHSTATQAGRLSGADPNASSHMGGFPMGMMMGGMGGQTNQNGRMAAVPNEARPEVWDPVTGAPVAVGRRESEPAEEKPEERLSKAEIQAAFAEKLEELDRLTERGK